MSKGLNVLKTELQSCCMDPITGFYRDGFCHSGGGDHGLHLVCVIVTEEFLEYSREVGNDLSTPHPEWQFPGLKEGDKWCLCMTRWVEAYEAGMAPQVVLEATHISALEFVDLAILKQYAYSS